MHTRALKHLRNDPVMSGVVERIGPIRLRARRLPPFEALVRAIIHQQLSGKAAGTILGRFEALFQSDGFPTPDQVLKLTPERLRCAGLSRAKAGFILGLAARTLAGEVPTLEECDAMTDEALIEKFTMVKGVGRWTVWVILN